MPRPTILAFNLSDARLSKLRFLCMKLGTLVKVVPQEDFTQPIAALAGLAERCLPPLGEEIGQSPAGEDAPEATEPFAEEMIVFCHMSNMQLNSFLKTAKQQRIPPFPLKAILTPTNAAWTAAQLCAELKEERAAIEGGGKAHPAQ